MTSVRDEQTIKDRKKESDERMIECMGLSHSSDSTLDAQIS